MDNNKKISCPVCEEKFPMEDNAQVGETICCPGCYSDLKITNLAHPKAEEIISTDDNEDEEEYYKDNMSDDTYDDEDI